MSTRPYNTTSCGTLWDHRKRIVCHPYWRWVPHRVHLTFTFMNVNVTFIFTFTFECDIHIHEPPWNYLNTWISSFSATARSVVSSVSSNYHCKKETSLKTFKAKGQNHWFSFLSVFDDVCAVWKLRMKALKRYKIYQKRICIKQVMDQLSWPLSQMK